MGEKQKEELKKKKKYQPWGESDRQARYLGFRIFCERNYPYTRLVEDLTKIKLDKSTDPKRNTTVRDFMRRTGGTGGFQERLREHYPFIVCRSKKYIMEPVAFLWYMIKKIAEFDETWDLFTVTEIEANTGVSEKVITERIKRLESARDAFYNSLFKERRKAKALASLEEFKQVLLKFEADFVDYDANRYAKRWENNAFEHAAKLHERFATAGLYLSKHLKALLDLGFWAPYLRNTEYREGKGGKRIPLEAWYLLLMFLVLFHYLRKTCDTGDLLEGFFKDILLPPLKDYLAIKEWNYSGPKDEHTVKQFFDDWSRHVNGHIPEEEQRVLALTIVCTLEDILRFDASAKRWDQHLLQYLVKTAPQEKQRLFKLLPSDDDAFKLFLGLFICGVDTVHSPSLFADTREPEDFGLDMGQLVLTPKLFANSPYGRIVRLLRGFTGKDGSEPDPKTSHIIWYM